jgi:hypothetical protein
VCTWQGAPGLRGTELGRLASCPFLASCSLAVVLGWAACKRVEPCCLVGSDQRSPLSCEAEMLTPETFASLRAFEELDTDSD